MKGDNLFIVAGYGTFWVWFPVDLAPPRHVIEIAFFPQKRSKTETSWASVRGICVHHGKKVAHIWFTSDWKDLGPDTVGLTWWSLLGEKVQGMEPYIINITYLWFESWPLSGLQRSQFHCWIWFNQNPWIGYLYIFILSSGHFPRAPPHLQQFCLPFRQGHSLQSPRRWRLRRLGHPMGVGSGETGARLFESTLYRDMSHKCCVAVQKDTICFQCKSKHVDGTTAVWASSFWSWTSPKKQWNLFCTDPTFVWYHTRKYCAKSGQRLDLTIPRPKATPAAVELMLDWKTKMKHYPGSHIR